MQKKIQVLLITLFIGCSIAAMAQSGTNSGYKKPINFQKRVTTIISGKTRHYYSLNIKKSSIINLRGPGILKVLTRGRFVPKQGKTINYEILYSIDGEKQKNVVMEDVYRSKNATYLKGSLGVPGQLKPFEIKLGRGSHTIEFKLKNNKIPVAARYKFIKTKKQKREWIAFNPINTNSLVDLITREKIVKYYRFSYDNPLKVTVNGPTELLVLTRIENHYKMKGRIHYRIQVREKENVINTYQLSSIRSDITVYKNENRHFKKNN